jgi:hypothetical protein
MVKANEYPKETNPELYEKIKQLIDYLDEIISLEPEVAKLKDHPIKDWHQYLLSDIYYDIINEAHLMMNEKEVSELFDDFSKSKNSKVKKLVFKVNKLSDELVDTYVETEFKESYLNSHLSTTKNLDRDELKNIKFMKNFF